MFASLLESYHPRKSPLHRLPARTKLIGALLLILAIVATPRHGWFLTNLGVCLSATVVLIAAAAASQLAPAFLLRRMLLLEPFVLGVAALSLWQPHGGLVFCQAVTRSTLCLAALVLLAATTPFSDIVRVLRVWRVPALLLTTLTLMDRYMFVLFEESGRLQRARASRTFERRSHLQIWFSQAGMLGQLFVRSVERAGRIYAAMCARGWDMER